MIYPYKMHIDRLFLLFLGLRSNFSSETLFLPEKNNKNVEINGTSKNRIQTINLDKNNENHNKK